MNIVQKGMGTMNVKKMNLLLLAGIIWTIAGFNILRIGVISHFNYVNIVNLLISVIVFAAFWFMAFSWLVKKHPHRIIHYEDEK